MSNDSGADYLTFSFSSIINPLASDREGLDGFIQPLDAYAGAWIPATVEGQKSRRRRYARAAVYKAAEETSKKDKGFTRLYFVRPSDPQVSLSLSIAARQGTDATRMLLLIEPMSFFLESANAEECNRLIELVRAWSSWCPPDYAMAHSEADAETSGDPATSPDYKVRLEATHDQIHAVYWINVFGKSLVDKVGRERVLSTPAHRVEELPGGSVLLVTSPTPDITSEPSRLAQARAMVHLRPELDFDVVMAHMRERNATLAPVEPRFDPDTADFMRSLLTRDPLSQRQRKIAEFNARRLPEVSEWLPAASALPTDVEDPLEEAFKYHALYAQQLVDVLGSMPPPMKEFGPESLSSVDYWIWLHSFPKKDRETVEQMLIPAVGGYLGMLMVRHLGGQWVPRRNLDEAHVLLGGRAWLPFLRARHYLQSKEALIDYSLNRFYRTAERYLLSLKSI